MTKNKKNNYDLSICMIVKNEEKYIEKCLQALMPLKDLLKCELIITDTGSTDNTLEIIKKYADKVIEFEWCNDFSKARNTGIDASSGDWLMYVDADEIYEDSITKIADFIKSKDRDKYDAGSVTMNNYAEFDSNSNINSTHIVSKLVNMTNGKRYFQGEIHEYMTVTFKEMYYTKAVVQHYGYTSDIIDIKVERNLPLLKKQFQNEPDNLRIVNLYVTQERDFTKRIELLEDLLTKDFYKLKNVENLKVLFVKLAESYVARNDYDLNDEENVIKTIDRFLEFDKQKTKPKLEIYFMAYAYYKKLGQTQYVEYHEKEIYFMSKYLELYDYLQKNPDTIHQTLMEFSNSTPSKYAELSYNLAVYYTTTGNDRKKANKLYKKAVLYKYLSKEDLENSIKNCIALGFELNQYDAIYNMHMWLKDNHEDLFDLSNELINIKYMELIRNQYLDLSQEHRDDYKKYKLEFLNLFASKDASKNININYYDALNTLRLNNYDISKCDDHIFNIIIDNKNLYEINQDDLFCSGNLYASEVLLSSIKSKCDKFEFFKNCSSVNLNVLIYCIHNNHKDFISKDFYQDFILANIKNNNNNNNDEGTNECVCNMNSNNIPELMLNAEISRIYLKETLRGLTQLQIDDPIFICYANTFNYYVKAMYISAQKIYSNDVIKNKKLKLLSPQHAFCICMYDGIYQNDNNTLTTTEYKNIMKQALSYCDEFINACKIMELYYNK